MQYLRAMKWPSSAVDSTILELFSEFQFILAIYYYVYIIIFNMLSNKKDVRWQPYVIAKTAEMSSVWMLFINVIYI